jgi:hypothetical protein
VIRCRTESFPLDDVGRVFDRLRQGDVQGRAVLVPAGIAGRL